MDGIPDELYLYPETRGYLHDYITDAEVNDILHYQDVQTEAGNQQKFWWKSTRLH